MWKTKTRDKRSGQQVTAGGSLILITVAAAGHRPEIQGVWIHLKQGWNKAWLVWRWTFNRGEPKTSRHPQQCGRPQKKLRPSNINKKSLVCSCYDRLPEWLWAFVCTFHVDACCMLCKFTWVCCSCCWPPNYFMDDKDFLKFLQGKKLTS